MNNLEGLILIDKPADWTSFDVVAKLRGVLRRQLQTKNQGSITKSDLKVGHAGTLDPFATGLLLILIGPETKNQAKYMKLDKEYEATLSLGTTSTTGDPEGKLSKTPKVDKLDQAEVQGSLNKFIGVIEQTPPQYSAIKVDGKRAYKLARRGEKVEIKPRAITIKKIEIIDYEWPVLSIRVACSSGTYLRTLAEDIGKDLGCGAYLTQLRRTKIGHFTIKEARSIEAVMSPDAESR